jgi:magnesium chelatase family protein
VGGGTFPRPGELSLAHLGVLFLDELAEFPRPCLEALRQPLEDGALALGRAAGRASYPAEVLLVVATNPCPCGWSGVPDRCKCPLPLIARYRERISGPLRDRFDIAIDVKPVDPEGLLVAPRTQDVQGDLHKIERAVEAQRRRSLRLETARPWNSRIPGRYLPHAVEPTAEAERYLIDAARKLGLTGRGVHRVLRVARTVADLEGRAQVDVEHVKQALSLRVGS